MAEACPRNEMELEERLSTPSSQLIDTVRHFERRLLLLGAGGKMGPTLARMARRAADAAGRTDYEVIAVSRFSDSKVRQRLESWGVRTIACDLADPEARKTLPEATEVVVMMGYKFAGPRRHPADFLGRNAFLHAVLAEQYRHARIVCFSTGNVYPMVPVWSRGATETTPCDPLGTYAEAAYARELLMRFVSETHRTPVTLIRLNYAVDLRYGVPVDVANFIRNDQPVPLAMGYVNVVWERYANEVTLRAFALADVPPAVLNVTGPEKLSVREMAERLAEIMRRPVTFQGHPAPTAYLSDASRCHRLFGLPEVTAETLLTWVGQWILQGGATWNRPTKFWVRDGNY